MLKSLVNLAGAAAFFVAAPALAQVQEIDPNQAAEMQAPPPAETMPAEQSDWTVPEPTADQAAPAYEAPATEPAPATDAAQGDTYSARTVPVERETVARDDLINAAEGVFGRGAQGLGGMIENILRDQGEPVAYIAGQEAGAAFVLGVRYGSGTMHHQIEGERTVYWTGPSVGFDVGADANKVFVLVYNLHDSQDLFRRYPGAEGNAYFVGGFTAQYLRRGDIVLIPIRLGVGVRLGVNAGYMRFSERNRWVPF
jgi:hypothetical protein